MKKKLVSLLSLILVMVMVVPAMPVMVFANTESGDETSESGDTTAVPLDPDFVIACDEEAIYDSGTNTTANLSVPKADDVTPTKVTWAVDDETVFTVDSKGKLTALKAGTATVAAFVSYKDGDVTRTKTISSSIEIIKNDIKSIDYTPSKTTTQYIVKQKVTKSDLCIIATYADGSTKEITDYTFTPNKELKTTDTKIIVKLNGVPDLEIPIEVADINIKDLIEKIEITAPVDNKEFEVGAKLYKADVTIKLTYVGGSTSTITAEDKDVTITGESLDFSKGYHTFSNDDATAETRTIKVAYAGLEDTVTIKVKKPASSGSDSGSGSGSSTETTYTFKVKTAPTKKSYKVDEKFDPNGMAFYYYIVNGSTSIEKTYTGSVNYNEYTFKTSDIGKTSIDVNFKFLIDGKYHEYILPVTGLTVTAATDTTRIKEVTSVTLKDDVNFIEGTELTLANIEKIKVKFVGESTATTIYASEFDSYTFASDLVLEVYTAEGARKTSSTYRDTIRPDDIYEDEEGDKVVNLALRYVYYTSDSASASDKDGVYKFTAEITEADIAYYFKTKYITEYEDLEDALLYCNTQDDDIDENVFDISDVDEDDYLQLKLGKSFTLSSSYEFTPDNNIVIDLNGRNLTLYSDTFEFDEYEDFTITVKNTAANEAKLTYKDKDITIVLKKGDSVSFNEDNTTPGIYTVTVKFDSAKGTVTASPAISSGKITAGKGTEIKFTITPKTGYDVDTVKADAKSVVTDKDNYSVNTTTGVATYTLESLTKDITFEATFKAQKKAWQNPFSDVKSTANYYSAVEFVYENELFKGTTNTTFSPNTTMTRAMFVTVLGRLAGIDEATAARKYGNDSDFTDVSASNGRISYAVPYIKWAVENGIVEGYGDGTFGPENEITHQQMYVMMYRYARFVENKGGSFSSVSLSMSDRSSVADWATDAVKYAQYNDYLVYTNNTKTLIDPTGDAKRSELAMLLEQFCATVLGWAAE